ncbi:LVIVD repeat-containing protein [Candidatus Aenigmatarchaeota archaeon]
MKITILIILLCSVLLISGCTENYVDSNGSNHSVDRGVDYDPEDVNQDLTLETVEAEIGAAIDSGQLIGYEHYERLKQVLDKYKQQGIDVTELREKLLSVYQDTDSHEQEEQKEKKEDQKGVSVKGKGYAELVGVNDGVAAWLAKDIVIQVIDVSDPTNPSHIDMIETMGFASTVYQDDEYIYAVGSDGMIILRKNDMFGAHVSTFTSSDGGFWPSDITIDGNYIYFLSNELIIVDISDISNPSQISRTAFTGTAPTKIIIKDNYAFIGVPLGGFVVMDITDKKNPKEIAVHPFESHEMGLEIKGDYAYIAHVSSLEHVDDWYEFGSVLEVIDISDPGSLEVVGTLTVSTNFKGLDIEGNYAFITGSYPHRLTVVDITDPSNPREITFQNPIQTEGALKDISIQNGYAYIMDSGYGLRILDITDPTKPIQVADVNLQQMLSDIYVEDDKVYLVAEQRYFNVADVSDPENPILAYTEATSSSAYPYTSIVIEDDIAFSNLYYSSFYDVKDPYNPKQFNMDIGVDGIAVGDNYLYTVIGEVGLFIYDINNLDNPILLSTTSFAQGMCRDFSLDGNWVVCVANKPYSINVMDVSVLENPIAKGTYVFDEYVMSVTVKDGYVYAPRGEKGLDIFKIDSDGELTFLTNYDTNAYRVVVEGNRAYVLGGLEVLDISDPANPVKIDKINIEGGSGHAKIQNGYMYTVGGDRGLTVINLEDV